MIINFYNAEGKTEHIYEDYPCNQNIPSYDVIYDKNDPRYKLQQLQHQQEWERFKLKANIGNKTLTKEPSEDSESLPYNPNIIVVPQDPPETRAYTRQQVVKIEEDIPRQEHVYVEYERKENNSHEDTMRALTTKTTNENEINDIMIQHELKLNHPST